MPGLHYQALVLVIPRVFVLLKIGEGSATLFHKAPDRQWESSPDAWKIYKCKNETIRMELQIRPRRAVDSNESTQIPQVVQSVQNQAENLMIGLIRDFA